MHRKWCVCHIYKKIPYRTHSHAQLSTVTSLHDRHYIHRDVKPSNFMVRAGDVGPTIFLIDFGLAKRFREPATYLHTPYTTKHRIVGTLPFTSVNGQQGHTQSRRDDLESLAYTIIFLARGYLPWTIDSICNDHEAVLRKKMSITAENLCEGLPPSFSKFVIHVRSLGFSEKPDYEHLHTILLQCSETDWLSEAPPRSVSPPLCANCTPCLCDRV